MGKRYYCDYCDKTMVSSPSIIKTHNKGLLHQKLAQEHYHQYKDPEIILAEESRKKPCLRNAQGECQFGSVCRFSHYSRDEIDQLRDYVAKKNQKITSPPALSFVDLYENLQKEKERSQESVDTIILDNDGVTHVLPWTYNEAQNDDENLPPSIKKIKIEDFVNAEICQWGSIS